MRIGRGFDAHALKAGRKLVIGGVTIPHDKGLEVHSDADVLLHAICDALIGAAALGDIGRPFSVSPPQYPAMSDNTPPDLGGPQREVSEKAKPTERLGFTSRGEGIAAEAVALITW